MTRVVVLSSAMKVQRERERESLFVGEENTLYDALSLSLSVCVLLLLLFSLCFRAFFLSLFFSKERMERKMKGTRRPAESFALCLNPKP